MGGQQGNNPTLFQQVGYLAAALVELVFGQALDLQREGHGLVSSVNAEGECWPQVWQQLLGELENVLELLCQLGKVGGVKCSRVVRQSLTWTGL